MNVEPWQTTLAALTAPDGWLADTSLRIVTDDAGEVLSGLAAGRHPPSHLEAEPHPIKRDRTRKPNAATELQWKRNAALVVTIAHELMRLPALETLVSPNVPWTDQLGAVLVATALDSSTGVWPGNGGKPPFAGDGRAEKFFHLWLRKGLEARETSQPALLAHIADRPYGPESIQCWAQAWTADCLLTFLHWATSCHCASAEAFVQHLARNARPYLTGHSGFSPDTGPLPTKGRLPPEKGKMAGEPLRLHLELRVSTLVAQIIDGNEARLGAAADAPTTVAISMKALDERRRGSNTFWCGREVRQLYLALLAETLRATNERLDAGRSR